MKNPKKHRKESGELSDDDGRHKDVKFEKQWFDKAMEKKITDFYDMSTKQLVGDWTFGKEYTVKLKYQDEFRTLKVLQKQKIVQQREFIRDYNILKELEHPNIQKIVETFEDNINVYLLYEQVKGQDLSQMVKHNIVRLQEIKSFLSVNQNYMINQQQLAHAIHFCHKNKLVCRDIRPENIIIQDNRLFLVDIGLTFFMDFGLEDTFTLQNLHCMAPENLDKQFEKKSDCWAFGVITYYFMSGLRPFTGRSEESTLSKIRKLRELDHVTDDVRELINQCLQGLDTRFSSSQICEHPWILKNPLEQNNDQDLDQRKENFYIVIKKLPVTYKKDDVNDLCQEFGEILQIYHYPEKLQAIIEFQTLQETSDARDTLHNLKIEGKSLFVDFYHDENNQLQYYKRQNPDQPYIKREFDQQFIKREPETLNPDMAQIQQSFIKSEHQGQEIPAHLPINLQPQMAMVKQEAGEQQHHDGQIRLGSTSNLNLTVPPPPVYKAVQIKPVDNLWQSDKKGVHVKQEDIQVKREDDGKSKLPLNLPPEKIQKLKTLMTINQQKEQAQLEKRHISEISQIDFGNVKLEGGDNIKVKQEHQDDAAQKISFLKQYYHDKIHKRVEQIHQDHLKELNKKVGRKVSEEVDDWLVKGKKPSRSVSNGRQVKERGKGPTSRYDRDKDNKDASKSRDQKKLTKNSKSKHHSKSKSKSDRRRKSRKHRSSRSKSQDNKYMRPKYLQEEKVAELPMIKYTSNRKSRSRSRSKGKEKPHVSMISNQMKQTSFQYTPLNSTNVSSRQKEKINQQFQKRECPVYGVPFIQHLDTTKPLEEQLPQIIRTHLPLHEYQTRPRSPTPPPMQITMEINPLAPVRPLSPSKLNPQSQSKSRSRSQVRQRRRTKSKSRSRNRHDRDRRDRDWRDRDREKAPVLTRGERLAKNPNYNKQSYDTQDVRESRDKKAPYSDNGDHRNNNDQKQNSSAKKEKEPEKSEKAPNLKMGGVNANDPDDEIIQQLLMQKDNQEKIMKNEEQLKNKDKDADLEAIKKNKNLINQVIRGNISRNK